MQNYISLYYSIDAANLRKESNYYLFDSGNDNYILYKIKKNSLKNKNFFSFNNPLIHSIIQNNYGNQLSLINGEEWVLLKVNTTLNKKIDFDSVLFFLKDNILGYYKKRLSWLSLWINKIDYFEQFINNNDNIDSKIKVLCIYYIGMAENAVKYLESVNRWCDKELLFSLSHERIKETFTVVDLYNPFNIIEDHISRDISEYIKAFYDEVDIESIFNMINSLNLNSCDIEFLLSRLLFPSCFFDSFDSFYDKDFKPRSLLKYYDDTSEYELFIKKFMEKAKKNRNIIVPNIKWLNY